MYHSVWRLSYPDFRVEKPETTIPEDIESRREAAQSAVIDYAFHGEVVGWNPGQDKEFEEALRRGVRSFKFYTAYAVSGRRSDNGILYHAFQALAKLDGVAMIHCEEEAIIDSILRGMSPENIASMANLAATRPPICEASAIEQVAYLAQQTGVRVHIAHVSSGLGLAAVMQARKQGAKLTAETCPQYLLLDSNVYDRKEGHLFSATPALRTEEDQAQLWKGLADGALDFVATDHCPFTRKQKAWKGSFLELPHGLPGVETLLPLLYSEGVTKGKIPLTSLPRLLSEEAARIYGLYPKKGTLAIGSDADVVIFDPDTEWQITSEDLHMRTDFSPYEGRTVKGRASMTLSRGEIVFADGVFQGKGSRGRFISRN